MHEIFFVFYFIAVLYHVVKATTMNFVNFSQLMSTCYLSARVRDSCSWVWDSHSWICWLCESQDSLQLFSKWIAVPQEQHWKKRNTTQTPVISIVFQRSFFIKKKQYLTFHVLVDIKPFVGTVTNFTLKKQNEDSMRVKIKYSRPSLKKRPFISRC